MPSIDPAAIPIAAGIPVRDNRLLLGLRAAHRKSFANSWDVIGGHIEAGETPEAALRRELFEEIGIRPTVFDLVDMIMIDGARGTRLQLFVYRVTAWQGGEPRLANDEHAALQWFDLESACEIPGLASEAYVMLFRRLLDAAIASAQQSKLLP